MTDEELDRKATEYATTTYPDGTKKTYLVEKNAYIAGAKEKGIQWHKVADGEYPKTKGNYLVAWKRTRYIEEFGEYGFEVDLFDADEGYFEGMGDYVIAWCEIPQFEE